MKDFFIGLVKWVIAIAIIFAIAWFGWKISPQKLPIVIKDKIVAFGQGFSTGFSDFMNSTGKLKNAGDARFKEAQDNYNKSQH